MCVCGEGCGCMVRCRGSRLVTVEHILVGDAFMRLFDRPAAALRNRMRTGFVYILLTLESVRFFASFDPLPYLELRIISN